MVKINPYEVLGVDRDASPNEIKRAFRNLSKQLHPDAGGGTDEFAEAAASYALLMDQERRAKFDATGDTDDGLAGNEMAAVSEIINDVFGQILASENVELEYIDVIKEIRVVVLRGAGNLAANMAKAEKAKGRVVGAMSRLKHKDDGASNPLAGFMGERLVHLERNITAMATAKRLHEMALEHLKDYSWRMDERQAQTISFSTQQAGAGTGSFFKFMGG